MTGVQTCALPIWLSNRVLGGDRAIYQGSYKSNKEGYKEALKRLISQGNTESKARVILREIKPQKIERASSGILKTIESSKGIKFVIKASEKSVPVKSKASGMNTRLGKGKFKNINKIGRASCRERV